MVIKFIDLFAGIGGIRLGFEQAGAECVFSSEWDKFAQQTYKANFGEMPWGDIDQINVKHIPSFDVLCAGFPCQPFSKAGLQLGFQDSRGNAFLNIYRIILYHRPRVVFLENVKGFLSHNKGETICIILRYLQYIGYTVYYDLLNSKDFGLPQNRERLYIVAFKDQVDFKFPDKLELSTLVGDILEKEVDDKYTISDKLWAGHQRRKEQHRKKGNGFGYKLFDYYSEYTSTLSARYGKDGSEILIDQLGKNPRKLTPRECARLQGFPENYIIPVSDTQAYKQFGNSVSVPVIYEIAKRILKSL